jgi:hypothetical protein
VVRRREAAAAAAVPTGAPTTEADARIAALERLGSLHDSGVLDDAEFAAEKSRILAAG